MWFKNGYYFYIYSRTAPKNYGAFHLKDTGEICDAFYDSSYYVAYVKPSNSTVDPIMRSCPTPMPKGYRRCAIAIGLATMEDACREVAISLQRARLLPQ